MLWERLRDRRLGGLKFRRQAPVGPYVVDFPCVGSGLVVETDGPFHDPDRDAVRDRWLVSQGLKVLRFSNDEVHEGLMRVTQMILEATQGIV